MLKTYPSAIPHIRARLEATRMRVFASAEVLALCDLVPDLLETRGGGVSFAELHQLPGAAGDVCVVSTAPNVILWPAASTNLAMALRILVGECAIHFEETHFLVYAADGFAPRLPIATAAGIKPGYRRPHWLPSVVERGERLSD